MENNLVYLDEYDLLGINYYWDRRAAYNLTDEELAAIGVTDNRVQVAREIIEPLQAVDAVFQTKGYRLFVKEGYRSPALYELAYQKRVERFGQADIDKLLNMNAMPHATGKTVDVTLWDPKVEAEVYLRNGDDGTEALFVDFYKSKSDTKSQWYQSMQEFVITTMLDQGFRLGSKREYFHFDYAPERERNY